MTVIVWNWYDLSLLLINFYAHALFEINTFPFIFLEGKFWNIFYISVCKKIEICILSLYQQL